MSWLAVEVLSPYQIYKSRYLKQNFSSFLRHWVNETTEDEIEKWLMIRGKLTTILVGVPYIDLTEERLTLHNFLTLALEPPKH